MDRMDRWSKKGGRLTDAKNSAKRKNVNESKSTGKMIFWNVVAVLKKG